MAEDKPQSAEQKKQFQQMLQNKQIEDKLNEITHKIMVMSGKGGVGKSTTAANLAIGLSKRGYKVGILDTDLHGPSITNILGLEKKRVDIDDKSKQVIPISYSESLNVISIQFLLQDPDSALIWRGPIKIGVIRQFIADVNWGKLDYLIIDSPPGTGDEPLTVAQTVPGCQALIVTTPQYVSLADVKKSINFCKQVKMPILGILENMSGFTCPHCGEEIDLFKKHGGKKVAEEFSLNFLGAIPIDPEIVEMGDSGISIFDEKEDSKTLIEYNKILDEVEGLLKSTKTESKKSEVKKNKKEEKTMTEKKDSNVTIIALPTVAGKLCEHFGHCEKFAMFEVKGTEIKATEPLAPPSHAPGVIPEWLSKQNTDIIIAGGMGSRAKNLFTEFGIEVITGVVDGDSPEEIVKRYVGENLEIGENICDH